ncbi:hypothetical protein Q5752_002424 [Cryptotrichosporon argae]
MRPLSHSLPAFVVLSLAVFPSTLAQNCLNYGTSSSGACLCPAGFTSSEANGCTLPNCGGSLYDPGASAPGGTSGLGNVSAGACGCTSGWGGPGCTVCSTASACSSSLSGLVNASSASASNGINTTLTCSTVPTTYSVSQMTCSVIQATLQALFPLSSTLTITRALNTSLAPGGASALAAAGLAGADGQLWAQLWYDGVEQFYCSASECTQATSAGSAGVNGSVWTCETLACQCRPGADFCGSGTTSTSQNLTGAINVLAGPLTVDCQGNGKCSFEQKFLNALFGSSGLALSACAIGECVEQYVVDAALGITAAAASGAGLGGGVIAGLAVVGAIFLAIAGLVVYGLVARRRARRAVKDDGTLPPSGGVGIVWEGVGYEVRAPAVDGWARGLAWLRGAGPRRGVRLPEVEDGDVDAAVGPHGGRVVLRDACGRLAPGGFCCVLGPSGAGKSTLVDVLAGKRKGGNVEGRVAVVGAHGRRVKIGYVDQSDELAPTSTVYETLLFAAQLRLPEHVPLSVKAQRARDVLARLGLAHVADTRVGSGERRGVSGGEMRRVSIGVELVAAPDVLVLDEPTSGLDSVSAARLVRLLKTLTETGTTVVASVHQPSSALYRAFDHVCLLARGRQLYFGPGRDRPAQFFARQGRPCPAGYNVADHLLEIASADTAGLLSGQAAMDDAGDDDARSSSHGAEAEAFSEKVVTPSIGATYPPPLLDAPDDMTRHGEDAHGASWWPTTHCATSLLTQIEVLSGREWRNLKRDKTLLVAHVALAAILGVFAGGLYFKVDVTIAGFQNRIGSLFFLGSLIAFSSLSALYNLVEIRPLFLRERAGSFYSPHAWLLTRIMFDVVPLRLIPTIIVSVIVYFMVGLSHQPARFFKYLLILVEYSSAMTLFNFLLASVFSHAGIAILVSSLCNLFLMTYAGFFVNLSQIPPVLRWLRYLSTLGYTLEALAINEVGSGLQIIDTLDGVPVEIGAVVIMQTLFGFGVENYYRDVLVLFAFIAGFAVLLVLSVFFILHERR